ncbi:MAG: Holliday junction resolvase RuvX [Hyphomicrobiaceae bacterium]|nr:Holliday junction resolvase RuvX [Hyphomicrobiaceae bacterium]
MALDPARHSNIDAFASALPPSGRLMGLDLGTKTIGIAVSDTTRLVASSLETLTRRKFTLDVEHLQRRSSEHDVVGIVIGLPINLDGTEGPRAQSTRTFTRLLSDKTPLPLLLWDERLTTIAAERALLEADTSRKRRAEVIDKVAAGLILQGLLDRLRATHNTG